MKKLVISILATLSLAIGGFVIAPTVLGSPSSGVVQAAEAVPYKLPAGTWGRQTHYYDRFHACINNMEVRYREDYRMYWNGTKWYNAIYFRGTYYAKDHMGYARYCGRV